MIYIIYGISSHRRAARRESMYTTSLKFVSHDRCINSVSAGPRSSVFSEHQCYYCRTFTLWCSSDEAQAGQKFRH
eukprot:1272126-Pyramimonas_sp.AAC.1